MSMALAKYLKDFSEPQPIVPVFEDDAFADGDLDVFAAPPEPPAPDPEELRREAYAEGYEAAERECGNRHAAELEARQTAHQQALDALRQQYEAEAAVLIAEKIREMAGVVAHAVSDQTAQVLAPLLSETLAAKAVKDMATMIRQIVLDGTAATITVKGPQSLFDILQAQLGEDVPVLRYVEMSDLDLTVEMDGTVLVSRLSAWTASLKKVLE